MLFLDIPPYGYDNAVIKWLDERLEDGDDIKNLFELKKLNPDASDTDLLLGQRSGKYKRMKRPRTFRDCLESSKEYILNEYGVEIKFSEDIPYSSQNDLHMNDLLNYEDNSSSKRVEHKVTILRLVRDSAMARRIRCKYNYCQLCRTQLRDSKGKIITEAHHIRPYNKIHQGDDNIRNLIVLCPNCHTQFDSLYYAINPETELVNCIFNDEPYHLKRLDFIEGHSLRKEYLEYTWKLFEVNRLGL